MLILFSKMDILISLIFIDLILYLTIQCNNKLTNLNMFLILKSENLKSYKEFIPNYKIKN